MDILILLIVLFVVIFGGGGLFYFLFMKSKPKSQSWKAKVYQISEGVKPLIRDEEGNIISKVRLNDMIPYATDTVIKLKSESGDLYKLIKLNMTLPAVTADLVENWGTHKEVSVIIKENSATLLKKGYDKITGDIIFNPMKRERTDMLLNEIKIRKSSYGEKKDILQAITPWIVAGICILGLIAVAFFNGQALIKGMNTMESITKQNAKALEEMQQKNMDFVKLIDVKLGYLDEKETLGKQEPAQKPESIE